jgi:hypothetical protein
MVDRCNGKHLAKGLCRKHYMKLWRKSDTVPEEPNEITEHIAQSINPIDNKTTQSIEPIDNKTKGGYQYDLEENIKMGQEPPLSMDGPSAFNQNTLPLSNKKFYVSIGIQYVEMAFEFLNDLAPSAKTKLALTEIQKTNLQMAFDALGFGTNNPWVVIFITIVPPLALFCIINYKELKKNLKEMFADFKGLLPSLMPKTFQAVEKIRESNSNETVAKA